MLNQIESFFDQVYDHVITIACLDTMSEEASYQQLITRIKTADLYKKHAFKTMFVNGVACVLIFSYAPQNEITMFAETASSLMTIMQGGIAWRNINYAKALQAKIKVLNTRFTV